MNVKKDARPSRLKRRSLIGTLGAAFALALSAVVPTAAFSAPPQAGTYEGTSTAYNGATMKFEIDSNGVISNVESQSYCTDGSSLFPVTWVGGPGTPIEAGQSFDFRWEVGDDDFGTYYELTGTVNADGSAEGTGRAGIYPSGTCGGMNFTWSANLVGGGDPDPVYDPEVLVNPASLTESELAQSGLHIEGVDFPPSSNVDLLINGATVDSAQSLYNGSVIFEYTSSSLGVGSHEVRLTSGAHSVSTSVTVIADPIVYDPSASVSPAELTESELADTGVTISGEGFAPNSTVTLLVAGADQDSQQTNNDGDVTFVFISDSLGVGTHTAALQAAEGADTASFTVTADPVVYDPSVAVSPTELTEAELAGTGVTISGEGFAPESTVTLLVDGLESDTDVANTDGEVSFTYATDVLGVGTYAVELTAAEGTATASFTVIEDAPEPTYEPEVAVSPQELTVSELAVTGVVFTGTDFPEESTVVLTINGAEVATQISDLEGSVAIEYTSDSLGVGTHDVVLTSGSWSAETAFVVTEDPIVYDPSASVSPAELTESQLAATGVTITGDGFAAESTVTLAVNDVTTDTLEANADGVVVFTIRSVSLGVGTHLVELVSAEGAATTSFTVTEDITDPVYNPSVSFAPAELTESELANTGVSITGHDFPADSEVRLLVAGENAATETSNDQGEVTFVFTSSTLGAGEYEFRLEADAEGAWITSSFTVTEDAPTDPVTIPEVAPVEDDLDPIAEGEIEVPSEAHPGSEIVVTFTGIEAGTEVGIWLFSNPIYLGTHTVDANGQVTVLLPADTPVGEHRVGAWTVDGLVGWASIAVTAVDDGDDDGTGDDGTGDDGTGDDGTGDDGTGDESKDDELADTGTATMAFTAGAAVLMLLAGAGLLLLRRRQTMLS